MLCFIHCSVVHPAGLVCFFFCTSAVHTFSFHLDSNHCRFNVQGPIHTSKSVSTKHTPGRVGRQQGSTFKKHLSIATSILYFDDSCDDSDDDVGSGAAVAGGVGASLATKEGGNPGPRVQAPIRAGAGAGADVVRTGRGMGGNIGAASFASLQPLLVIEPEPEPEPSVSTTYINTNINIPNVGSPRVSLLVAPHASPSRLPDSVHSKPQYRPKSFLLNARDPHSSVESAVEVLVIRSPGAMQGGEEARELQRIRETKSKIDLRSDAVPAPIPSHALPDPSIAVKVQLKVSAHAPGPSTTVASLMQQSEADTDAFRLELSMPSLNVPLPKTQPATVLRI